MSTTSFTGEIARLQRANAESHDNVVRQSKVLAALNLRTRERVLEVGCGGGYLTYQAARFVGPTGGSARSTSAPTRSWQRSSDAPNSPGSNVATRILHQRPMVTPNLMLSSLCRCSSIWPISTPV